MSALRVHIGYDYELTGGRVVRVWQSSDDFRRRGWLCLPVDVQTGVALSPNPIFAEPGEFIREVWT